MHEKKEIGIARFSKRTDDAMTDRELLAEPLMGIAKTPQEKNKLSNYKQNVHELNAK